MKGSSSSCGGAQVVVRRYYRLLWWWFAGKIAGKVISSFFFLFPILLGLQWHHLPKVDSCILWCREATVDFLSSSRKCAPNVPQCTFLCQITPTHINNLQTWKHTLNAWKCFRIHLTLVIRNIICPTNKGKSSGDWPPPVAARGGASACSRSSSLLC